MKKSIIHELQRNKVTDDQLVNLINIGHVVVLRNLISNLPAIKHWPEDLNTILGDTKIEQSFLQGNFSSKTTTKLKHIGDLISSGKRTVYLHDYPFYKLDNRAINYFMPFPNEILPEYYSNCWGRFFRLFWSSRGASTPLHFDKLATNNLFFQVNGKKRFFIIHRKFINFCYLRDWKWSLIKDVKNVDSTSFPLFTSVEVETVDLNAGDVMILPAYTLHQVESLTNSVSANIDWHSKQTSISSLKGIFQGMPIQVFFKNIRFFLLTHGVPYKILFPSSFKWLGLN
jgi:hypothetical protein